MRKTILSVLAITAIIAVSCSQKKGDTPEAVTAAFNKKFADAKEVKWDKENEHEYEAEFKWDGKDVSANFSDAGEWMETESAIPYTDLPAAVASAFEKAYGKVDKAEGEKIETAKGTIKYEVEYTIGKDKKEVVYNADGTESK